MGDAVALESQPALIVGGLHRYQELGAVVFAARSLRAASGAMEITG